MSDLAPTIDVQPLNTEFEHTDPKSVLRWAVKTFGESLAVVTSLQPTGIVTLHMLTELRRELGVFPAVLTLDTGLLFPETYALMEEIEARFDIQIQRIRPELTVEQQAEQHGSKLWERQPDACCEMRKVVPLGDALAPYPAWVAGLRRDQSGRANTPIITIDKRYHKVKLSPLATWDESTVDVYIAMHELPVNPLHAQGYPSIGCTVCTKPATNGDTRSGRWMGQSKLECGIHLAPR